jgi:hypothetical protein
MTIDECQTGRASQYWLQMRAETELSRGDGYVLDPSVSILEVFYIGIESSCGDDRFMRYRAPSGILRDSRYTDLAKEAYSSPSKMSSTKVRHSGATFDTSCKGMFRLHAQQGV